MKTKLSPGVNLSEDIARPQEYRLRNYDSQLLGRPQIDHQLDLRRLLDRLVAWL